MGEVPSFHDAALTGFVLGPRRELLLTLRVPFATQAEQRVRFGAIENYDHVAGFFRRLPAPECDGAAVDRIDGLELLQGQLGCGPVRFMLRLDHAGGVEIECSKFSPAVMSTGDEVSAVLARMEDDMRKIVDREGRPYDAGWRIWGDAFSHAPDSRDIMWPMWLLWGALTDWVEVKPDEESCANEAMRRAAREWLDLPRDSDSTRLYFDRWLDELGCR